MLMVYVSLLKYRRLDVGVWDRLSLAEEPMVGP